MATLIIQTGGGLVNEVFSSLSEPLAIQVYDADDVHDPEHAHLYAACSYAASFANLWPHTEEGPDEINQACAPLLRRPESERLVSELHKAATGRGAEAQALDAAFAAGYLEAIGELKVQLDMLLNMTTIDEKAVRSRMGCLLDQQLWKYFDFCGRINEESHYDREA